MWLRVVTTLFCLIALCAELTFDSSTAFVRDNAYPIVGRLVVVNAPPVDQKQLPKLLQNTSTSSSDQTDTSPHDNGASDLFKVSGATSHAGQVAVPMQLSTHLPVARYVSEFQPPRLEPHSSDIHRPPSA